MSCHPVTISIKKMTVKYLSSAVTFPVLTTNKLSPSSSCHLYLIIR